MVWAMSMARAAVPPPPAPPPGRRRPRVAARLRGFTVSILTIACAFVLALLLAEGTARVLGWPTRFPPMARISNRKGSDIVADSIALLCYPTNPRGYFAIDLRNPATRARYEALGMRNLQKVLPNLPYAVEQRYNSEVFRGDELPPRRAGVRRVIVMGDSFNQGWGVREEDMYSRRIEALLNSSGPERWEVLNCARHDADFPRLWFLFRTALAHDPDLVIYGMTMNDPERTPRMAARLMESSPLVVVRGGPLVSSPPPGGSLLSHSRLMQIVEGRLEARRREQSMLRWYLDLFGEPNGWAWRETKGYLRQMNEQMQARGGRFLLVTWPLLVDLDGDYPLLPAHETIAHFAQNAGIAHYDLLDCLRGHPAASLWVHPVDRHPNEVAQRLVAEALAPVVRALAESRRER
jgi:lysophospholipase L1-like esterase